MERGREGGREGGRKGRGLTVLTVNVGNGPPPVECLWLIPPMPRGRKGPPSVLKAVERN